MALGGRMPLHRPDLPSLIVPTALFTIFTGVFLIVARRKALTQCLGYLVIENGIYCFGVAAVGEVPALVELGVAARPLRRRAGDGHRHLPDAGGVRPHGHRPAHDAAWLAACPCTSCSGSASGCRSRRRSWPPPCRAPAAPCASRSLGSLAVARRRLVARRPGGGRRPRWPRPRAGCASTRSPPSTSRCSCSSTA